MDRKYDEDYHNAITEWLAEIGLARAFIKAAVGAAGGFPWIALGLYGAANAAGTLLKSQLEEDVEVIQESGPKLEKLEKAVFALEQQVDTGASHRKGRQSGEFIQSLVKLKNAYVDYERELDIMLEALNRLIPWVDKECRRARDKGKQRWNQLQKVKAKFVDQHRGPRVDRISNAPARYWWEILGKQLGHGR